MKIKVSDLIKFKFDDHRVMLALYNDLTEARKMIEEKYEKTWYVEAALNLALGKITVEYQRETPNS